MLRILTQQSRLDVDTLFRQPDALASIQRPWPTIEAAILAATQRAETEVGLVSPSFAITSSDILALNPLDEVW